MVYGPDDIYLFTGYANFAAHPGLNTISINVRGNRKLSFKNGLSYVFNNVDVS